jgi:hypothetical protein
LTERDVLEAILTGDVTALALGLCVLVFGFLRRRP